MELISEIFFYILVSQWYAAHPYTGSFSPLSSVDDLKVITTRQIEFMTLVLWDISTGWPYQSENMAIDPFYMKVSISGSYTVDSI
jgi:hypothetical protein